MNHVATAVVHRLTAARSSTTRLLGRRLSHVSAFEALTESDRARFERIVGSSNVLTSELESYNTDWTKKYIGRSRCVVLPGSEQEVSAVLKHCNERKLAVCVQGGNTGLVGGGVPVADELLLSTRRLTSRFEFDPITGRVQCDAGWVLQAIDEKLVEHGWMVPIDLGARGSCQIGGNVATGAGGIRLVRYGSLHAHLTGLRVVLANGDAVQFGSGLHKDNSSLHSHHLFVGSEGQLGVITHVLFNAVPRPGAVESAWLGTDSWQKAVTVLRLARNCLADSLSSFELLDKAVMDSQLDNCGIKSPLATAGDRVTFNLLVEAAGTSSDVVSERMNALLEKCVEEKVIVDGAVANSTSESRHMWHIRETSPAALMKDGYCWKHDVSLPLKHFYELSEAVREKLKGTDVVRVGTFGHMADGNSHLNVTARGPSAQIESALYPWIYEWIAQRGGSISAEHGMGQQKRGYVALGKSPQERGIVRQLKTVFDPLGILNPGKTIEEFGS